VSKGEHYVHHIKRIGFVRRKNLQISRYGGKTIAELKDAYSDMLRPFFEQTTGLRTSL
jgi:hypothetical protein